MKTLEDEAFDEMERRQGGGFQAKRAMAADKQHNLEATVFVYKNRTGQIKAEYIDAAKLLDNDPDWEHVATLEPRMWIEYHYAETEAEKQEPPAWWPAVENILNEYGLQAIDFVADFKKAIAEAEKLESDDDLTIAYMSGVHDGKASAKVERNFCERCGKRLGKNDWDIHTCTPPSEEA